MPLARAGKGVHECAAVEEIAALDRAVDAHQVLEDDAACPDGEVADLGVPHLPRWEPNGFSGGAQCRVRIPPPEVVENRCLRKLDRVSGAGRRAAPAVQDHERYERERAAAAQILVKESTSSEAPPTSAPSTSAWPNIGSTLS